MGDVVSISNKQITVARGKLLESQAALQNLGKVYLPVEKERHWFVKTLDKIKSAFKQQNNIASKHSDALVKKLGKEQPNGVVGITPQDTEAMSQYKEEMEAFMEVPVTIEVKQITLTQLKDCSVSLTADDQVALMWLMSEE